MAGYKANIGPKGEEAGKTGKENAPQQEKSKPAFVRRLPARLPQVLLD
jgi:hypothetical protein